MIRPQLWIIAGPNGAGKSTFVDKINIAHRIPLVNPDSIARALSDRTHASIEAGRQAVEMRRIYLANNTSFALETTLTGHSELMLMGQAKAAGYKVNLVYIGLPNASLSRLRVAERVRQGGHDVPLADIFRRYSRSLQNLAPALALADRAYVLDNAYKGCRLLFSLEAGRIKHRSLKMPEWANRAIPDYYLNFGSAG
ncbi:MAG: AAA family ATPase [Candidatus Contendobacter sp.]|nr:MAG: AAA family ATPase [Candidatus Contendobacter sp.]